MQKIALFASAIALTLTTASAPAMASPLAETKADGDGNTIAAIASTNESFNVLTALLKHAELVGILNSETEFTVFAPTDDAFGRLPEGTIESLFQPENQALLKTILTYHVVPGRVTSGQLSSGEVGSAAAIPLSIVVGSGVTVNGANVVMADIEASNGVIHVIDAVLLPPQ